MMYYYWTRHGIRPSVLYQMPPGERLLIRAFYEYDREQVEEALKKRGQAAFATFNILDIAR